MINNKQAILIMYHNDYYILEHLLQLIDNSKIDIYLHVDKKVKNFDFKKTKNLVRKSNLFFTKRISVGWSSYDQIKCEYLLLKEAIKNKYKYYHLISGVDLPIKNIEIIYDFFNKENHEFIAFKKCDDISNLNIERIKYYHFLNKNRRSKCKLIRKISNIVHDKTIILEKKIGVNRLKKCNMTIRKGANWFSITNDCANYVLNNEKKVKKMFNYSWCGDELFLQTLIYNSNFKNKVYSKYNDEHLNTMRLIDWNRGEPYIYKNEDYFDLINSSAFFARKFSTSIDKKIIDKIYNKIK